VFLSACGPSKPPPEKAPAPLAEKATAPSDVAPAAIKGWHGAEWRMTPAQVKAAVDIPLENSSNDPGDDCQMKFRPKDTVQIIRVSILFPTSSDPRAGSRSERPTVLCTDALKFQQSQGYAARSSRTDRRIAIDHVGLLDCEGSSHDAADLTPDQRTVHGEA
jgi:hypothetical protein